MLNSDEKKIIKAIPEGAEHPPSNEGSGPPGRP